MYTKITTALLKGGRNMIKVGTIVKYKKEWCTSPEEENYRHVVKEVRLNPVTGKMSRFLIETINTKLTLNPTEVVDIDMIEEV